MNEETYLIERVGKENPFRVPEGYFDSLASEVMARVDASGTAPRKAKVVWLRPAVYAVAAALCALFVSVAAYRVFQETPAVATDHQSEISQLSDDSFDEAIDYVMVDNQDIYACLSSDY